MKKLILTLLVMPALLYQAYGQLVDDFDGNYYETNQIGTQTWFLRNLKSTHYYSGASINGAYQYNDDSTVANIYGNLYKWNSAMNNSNFEKAQGVCPDGWHIPSNAEWDSLSSFLGGQNIAGGALKEENLLHWQAPNTGATNSHNFSALPSGQFTPDNSGSVSKSVGIYNGLNEFAKFWSSTATSSDSVIYWTLTYNSTSFVPAKAHKSMAFSVRCIQGNSSDVKNYKMPFKYTVLPNPASEEIFVEFAEKEYINNMFIKVSDCVGNTIISQPVNTYKVKFNISNYPAGIYFIQVQTPDNVIVRKIIKK